jgi:hypothetical protein
MEGPPKASTRRRRLVERGSDRLAFITGQASVLPPSDPYPGNHRGAKFFSFVRIRKPVAFTPDWIRLQLRWISLVLFQGIQTAHVL